MKSLALVLALAACHHATPATAPGPARPAPVTIANTDPLGPRLDAIAQQSLDDHAAVGLSLAVMRGGAVVWAKGYGYADIIEQRPATADTVYRIGSLTKQFTAAAIVQLAEAGKLAYDDRVSKYVGGLAKDVTLAQLLHHTSGLPSYTDQPGFEKLVATKLSPAEIVALVKDVPWDFEPGTKYSYSNTGYVVLGMVVEKVSGEPYAQYLAKHVFAPAGLAQTSYCDESKPDPHRARGYAFDEAAKPKLADPIDLSVPFSAGALCSTVTDLVKWTVALRTGKVVSPAGYRAMTTSHGLPDQESYGFGLQLGDFESHREVFHNGGINGFISELHDFPDDDVTIAVLTNIEGAASKVVEKRVAMAELGIASKAVAIAPAELAAYAGTYAVPMLGDVVVAVDGDHLTLHPEKQGTFALEYRGHDTFVFDEIGAQFTFEREGGKVTGLVIKQGSHDIEGKRK